MDLLLEASRFLTYAAALQMFGAAVFQRWLTPGALAAALDVPVRGIVRVSVITIVVGMLGWLMATAGTMGDGWIDARNPGTLWLVLSSTAFGHVWQPLGLLAIATAGYALLFRANWSALALAATALLIGLGLVGHAAIASGVDGLLNRVSQIVHLLSSAFWLGALVPLLISLRYFRDPAYMADCDTMLRRFSGLGHLAVALLLLSGVTNSWFVLGGARLDLSQPYQQLLVLKIALALTMVGLATINRYVFVPAIPDNGPGLGQLARGTIAEIVISAGVLVLVSIVGTMSPG